MLILRTVPAVLGIGWLWLSVAVLAADDNVLGRWKTIDDETGVPKSIVEIYRQGDEVYGKVVEVLPRPGVAADPVCEKCTDHRKGQKIRGMVILEGLKPDKDTWSDGVILDPAKGKTYRCTIWVENNTLKVRGYVGVFFRTQTWQRVSG